MSRPSSLYPENWDKLRFYVYKRDNWICQNKNCEFCNNKRGVILHAHHKKSFADYPELRFVKSNVTTLCYECHNDKRLKK